MAIRPSQDGGEEGEQTSGSGGKDDEEARARVSISASRIGKLTFIEQLHGDVYLTDGDVSGPPLSPPFGGGGRSRLIMYGYDVEFLGREAELGELRAFMAPRSDSTADFAWWLWSGPGGQGKTRLAAELCEELKAAGWRCGFLPKSTTYEAWESWVVLEPTLIIVDHIASRPDDIRAAIAALARSADQQTAPLRILMLERSFDNSDAWVDDLIPRASPMEAAELLSFAYRPDGQACRSLRDCNRPLAPLPEADLRSIVSAVAEAAQEIPALRPDPASVVDWLRRCDVEMRPLFLVLATRAACDTPRRIFGDGVSRTSSRWCCSGTSISGRTRWASGSSAGFISSADSSRST